MSLPLNQVIVGDSAKVMAEWPENSVDCIVTDPPYGIDFMGKSWDKALPPKAVFAEMYRVLKPGALAFAYIKTDQLREHGVENLWDLGW